MNPFTLSRFAKTLCLYGGMSVWGAIPYLTPFDAFLVLKYGEPTEIEKVLLTHRALRMMEATV